MSADKFGTGTTMPEAPLDEAVSATNGLTTASPNQDDLFADLSTLRLPQNFETVGVTPVLTTVPVRKPQKAEFFRAHPKDRLDVFVLETLDREVYLIEPSLGVGLGDDVKAVTLVRAVTRQVVELLWPIPLPSDGRAPLAWHTSAREAADMGRENWVRLRSDMSLGAYRVDRAEGDLGEPRWSDNDLNAILRIAFRDRYISSMGHPLIRQRLGLE